MRIIGVDLSLAKTGVAGDGWHIRLRSLRESGLYTDRGRRIYTLAAEVASYTLAADLVVIEGPSYGNHQEAGAFDRAGLWWQVALTMQGAGVPYAVVPPTVLKKFVTGTGAAHKSDVIREVTRRFDWFTGDDNEADAVGLMAMGYAHYGPPVTTVPTRNAEALAKVDWPPLPNDDIHR